jgi:hypothetical protein
MVISALIEKFRSGLSKFQSLLPIYGFWATVRQLMLNIFLIEIVYRFDKDLHVMEEKVIPKIPLEINSLSGYVDFNQWGIQDEILKIRGIYGLEQFRARLAKGDVIFCAYSNAKFAGFIWLQAFPVKGAGYPLKDHEAYHIDGWVFEPYRGKAVLPALQQSVFDYLRVKFPKTRVLIGHAAAWNKPSIIGQQRAGLILVARELSLVFLGFHRKFRLSTIKKIDL